MKMLELMKKFTAAYSVSGCESKLREIIKKEIEPYADSITVDNMGNLIAFKKGEDSSKKLMTASHMDEIGFVATYIDDKGYIRVARVGGISPLYSSFHAVRFENGVNGVMVVDEKKENKDLKVGDLIIDIGAKDKKDAEKKVKIGDTCAIVPSLTRLMNSRYSAKALDDRIGCAINAYALKNIKKAAYDTYFVFTVQEEVGLRGSKPATFAIKPDYAIAIDVTGTGDTVGCDSMNVRLGGGAAIKIKDESVICSKQLVDSLIKTAKDNDIKYQLEVLPYGGTDTASMQTTGAGAHVACIDVPDRYVHSPVETIDMKDVMACADLLKAAVEQGVQVEL